MNNTLIDNSTDALSMQTYLKQCIGKEGIDHIRIATGYWDVPGMALVTEELKAFLERGDTRLQILIGQEPNVKGYYLKDPMQKFPDDYIKTDLLGLHIKEEYKLAVDLLLTHCKHTETDDDGQEIEVGTGRIEVNKYTEDKGGEDVFLHSKCYIFMGSDSSFGIIGSSNFTRKGLTQNAELNYLETNGMIITAEPKEGSPSKGHRIWFDEKWEQSAPWTNEFVNEIVKPSPIGQEVNRERKQRQKEEEEALAKPFTPYELYIKALQICFGTYLDTKFNRKIENYVPENYRSFSYQTDAVKLCYNRMKAHGGFLLADVVGLGKTVVAAMLVRHFLSEPQAADGRERRVLIITPPSVQGAWKSTLHDFFAEEPKLERTIDYITLGRLDKFVNDDTDEEEVDDGSFSQTLDSSKRYGLILIDESHRFRNSGTKMYDALNDLIGATSPTPYVGLLSATPQNNRPNDLKNQIFLFQRNHKNSTLTKANGGNLDAFFKEINMEYTALINNNSNLSADERRDWLDDLSRRLREGVLEDILIRRTRTDVEKYYGSDMEQQRLVFPQIIGPQSLEYVMTKKQSILFDYTSECIAPSEGEEGLTYARYRAIEYFVSEENKQKHKGRGSLTAGDVARQLAWLMQQSLVKRLESSASAFRESLQNLLRYTQNMIDMWENNTLFICPDINVNDALKDGLQQGIDTLRRKIRELTEKGKNEKGKNAEYTRDDFQEVFIELLQEDKKQLNILVESWNTIGKDPKLGEFKRRLSELLDPDKNPSEKLVIFTEAVVTADELEEVVKQAGESPLVVRSKNRNELRDVIRRNFDANCPPEEQRNDYNVIIATDTLAEGVNLHRANVILNYDTPWNATRLMQRIGRVNRIGSEAPRIYIYNFMPSAQGDEQIQLVRKAYVKLQSFHTLFGEDSKVFTEAERVVHYELVERFDQTVEQEGAVELEYVRELRAYYNAHRQRYRQIEDTDKGWEMRAGCGDTAYFLVQAAPAAPLAVRIPPTEQKAEVVSPLTILADLLTDPSAPALPLPKNWKKLSDQALTAYNQHSINISKQRIDGKIQDASQILAHLSEREDLSDKAEDLLAELRERIDQGNTDLAQRIIQTNEKQDWSQGFLDDTLEQAFGALLAENSVKQQQARIMLGTIK